MSSILHRENARVYVKQVVEGQSQLELSPEEQRGHGGRARGRARHGGRLSARGR